MTGVHAARDVTTAAVFCSGGETSGGCGGSG